MVWTRRGFVAMGVASWIGVLVAGCGNTEKNDAGPAGTAAIAGSGGSAQAGSGGSSSGGSNSGSGGTSNTPSEQDLLKAAVVIGSCWPDDGVNRNLVRMTGPELDERWFARTAGQVDCILQHGGGCEAVTACLGYTIAPMGPDCTTACNGSVLTLCGDGARTTIDCASFGLSCHPSGSCSDAGTPSCDAATFEPGCSASGRPERCSLGVVSEGPDCASFGLGCEGGYCTGTGETCTARETSLSGEINFFGLACNGAILEACVERRRHDRDCSALGPGFSCQSLGELHFCGLAAECEPGRAGVHGTNETCDGTNLVFCNAGHIERIDCTELGFTGCAVRSSTEAVCIPNFEDPYL